MANSKKTVDSVIADAERLAQVWSENAKFSMGDVTLTALNGEITKLRTLKQSRDQTRVDLSKLVDDTNDQMNFVDDLTNRGRNTTKGIFGSDSPQYAQVGGTRKASANLAHRRSPSLRSRSHREQASEGYSLPHRRESSLTRRWYGGRTSITCITVLD